MLLSKRVEKLEDKIAILEGEVNKLDTVRALQRVLKDEIFALQDELREKSKLIDELKAKLEEKEDTMTAQADEIRRWNEGLNNIMNYSLEVARGDKK